MAEEKTYPMTAEGLAKLQAELDDLITNKRPTITARIQEARAFGDLSENSEYQSAKDEQAFVEGRVKQLQQMIQFAQVIDASTVSKNVVTLGKTISFKEVPDGDTETYTIVGSAESDPLTGLISNDSPMGKALLNHKTGDQVEIPLPGNNSVTVAITHVAKAK
ncbi:transcription elongation factor GreA [Oenococcus sicerae]|uniref:Transcription elongation factor GreA n=1 Tax=Oenococcus sicerae TaxID=2203724 RepID=A0AAJ1RB35_9LACO|nr:transcription elongation factor GreA [Oenococcus sicerae]MDN6900835.1 transcription elongation factor GreA [Oenococcus sicerae]QAS69112.1 transcription elongation factor GreA [Oenococcus sicerae]